MSFRESLEALLHREKWAPIELAAALTRLGTPVYPQTVDRWLAGASLPRLDTARAIADVFGVSLDELVPSQAEVEERVEPVAV